MKSLLLSVVMAVVTSPLLASADLTLTVIPSATVVRAGYKNSSVTFSVHNAGPDTAVGVVLSVSSSAPVSCACDMGNIPAGQTSSPFVAIDVPLTAGQLTINATVTSKTPDPNPADNNASAQLTVSTDPDVVLNLYAPGGSLRDLALPFPLSIILGNFSKSDAHDVDIAVNFPTDALVQSLPSGCSSPAAGRIVCHADTIAADAPSQLFGGEPQFVATIIAPPAYGNGSIVFTATATEREHDFDPKSNSSGYTVLLYSTIYVTTTANEGAGSLRQAILDANANCFHGGVECTIAFRIDEPSPSPWKTIRITSPLPRVTAYVAVRNNRIFANRLLGIDIGLDGPTASSPSDFGDSVAAPALTLAHYDPVSKKTIIEGEIPPTTGSHTNFFANDGADPSGYGEGQRPLGGVSVDTVSTHFHFEVDGDLTGEWITATNTRSRDIGFAKPEGIDNAILTQTSEFSRAIEVR